jgi:hypothetical protein
MVMLHLDYNGEKIGESGVKTRIFILLFCSISFLATCQLSAQRSVFSDIKVEMKFVETIRIKSNENNEYKPGNKWLLIKLVYTMPEKKEGKSKDAYLWLDDMTLDYQVLVPSSYDGDDNFWALLSGNITFWSIPCDGKEHTVLAFVPPQIMRRYLRSGEKMRGAPKNIWAKITFFDKNRKILGYAFGMPKKESSKAKVNSMFQKADKPGSKVIKVPNSIYSRDETPWAPISFDMFDLIKKDNKK